MQPKSIAGALVSALIVGSAAMPAAPAQTPQPGQMTQARVWVQNRGRSEAVPVDVREVNLDRPLRVQVINGDPAQGSSEPVPVRMVRPVWSYKLFTVTADQDIAGQLTVQGANGWETTGTISNAADGSTTFLLKRPR